MTGLLALQPLFNLQTSIAGADLIDGVRLFSEKDKLTSLSGEHDEALNRSTANPISRAELIFVSGVPMDIKMMRGIGLARTWFGLTIKASGL